MTDLTAVGVAFARTEKRDWMLRHATANLSRCPRDKRKRHTGGQAATIISLTTSRPGMTATDLRSFASAHRALRHCRTPRNQNNLYDVAVSAKTRAKSLIRRVTGSSEPFGLARLDSISIRWTS